MTFKMLSLLHILSVLTMIWIFFSGLVNLMLCMLLVSVWMCLSFLGEFSAMILLKI